MNYRSYKEEYWCLQSFGHDSRHNAMHNILSYIRKMRSDEWMKWITKNDTAWKLACLVVLNHNSYLPQQENLLPHKSYIEVPKSMTQDWRRTYFIWTQDIVNWEAKGFNYQSFAYTVRSFCIQVDHCSRQILWHHVELNFLFTKVYLGPVTLNM